MLLNIKFSDLEFQIFKSLQVGLQGLLQQAYLP